MSWPQNPHDSQQPQQQPQQGFGPAPAWTPTGEVPQIQPPGPPAQPPQPPAQPPYGGPAQPPQGPPPPPPAGFPQHATAPLGQPPAAPPEPQAPQPARSRRTVLTVVGAVVALAVIGGGVAFALKGGGPKSPDSKPTAAAPSQTAPMPTEQGPNSTGNGPAAKPMIAGWQTQTWQRHGFAYDVPPASQQWKVAKPDLEISYTDQNGKPIVGMTGTSDYREGGCASAGNQSGPIAAGKGQLATIGTQGAQGGSLQENARNGAGNWGFAAYGGADGHKPKVTVSQATPWNHNGINGYTATATVTDIYQPSSCVPATATARAIDMRLKDGTTGIWIIYADQGVPNALTSADIDKIMGTVRPASAN